MKQVDIIRPCNINAIVGPISTLKRILKNKDYFFERGYNPSLFVNESITLQRPVEISDAKLVVGGGRAEDFFQRQSVQQTFTLGKAYLSFGLLADAQLL